MAWGWCAVLALGLLLPSAALARGAYVGLGTGIAYAPNERFSETPVFVDYDLGFRVGAVTLGYAFGNGLRAELEGAFRRNELEIIEFDDARGLINTGVHNSVDASSVMANAIYEFDVGLALRPYVGIGAGWAKLDYDISVYRMDEVILDDHDTAFAYQVIAGAGVPLGRRFHISADYRYWGHAKIDLTSEVGDPVRTDHPVHQASLTLRYGFAARERRPRAEPARAGGRWYSELRLGSIAAEDSDIEDGLPDTNFDAFDLGTALSFAAGYAWQNADGRGWRGELELSRWENHADVIDFGRLRGELRLSGPVEILGVGANLIYDFSPWGVLRPHAGLGVGFAEIDYDVTLHEAGVATQYVDDADSGFTVQALLGVGVRLTPRLQASLNYRYWWAPTVKLTDPQQVSLETEHSAHLLMLGLRYRLGN